MKRQATNGGRKNRSRPGNLREQIDPLMCMAYIDAKNEANGRMWPTPTAADTFTAGLKSTQQKAGSMHSVNLSDAVQMFPTPKANSHKSPSNCPNRQGSPDLQTVVEMMPTPVAGDCCGSSGGGMGSSLRTYTSLYPTPTTQDAKNATLPQSQIKRDSVLGQLLRDGNRGQLNPDWVEWLMGFSPGWTEIDAESDVLPRNPHWWDIEPPIPRVAKGIPNRVDRLKCLGNAVVPAQFYPIFMVIAEIQKIEPYKNLGGHR